MLATPSPYVNINISLSICCSTFFIRAPVCADSPVFARVTLQSCSEIELCVCIFLLLSSIVKSLFSIS